MRQISGMQERKRRCHGCTSSRCFAVPEVRSTADRDDYVTLLRDRALRSLSALVPAFHCPCWCAKARRANESRGSGVWPINLRPKCLYFQSHNATERDPGDGQRGGKSAGLEPVGTQRYALLFEPGTYGSSTDPLNFQVGYYTTVAGLGLSP